MGGFFANCIEVMHAIQQVMEVRVESPQLLTLVEEFLSQNILHGVDLIKLRDFLLEYVARRIEVR